MGLLLASGCAQPCPPGSEPISGQCRATEGDDDSIGDDGDIVGDDDSAGDDDTIGDDDTAAPPPSFRNATLSSLSGLAGDQPNGGPLATIGGSLYVSGNTSLTSIDGLAHLTTVGGSVEVIGNLTIIHVGGLGGLSGLPSGNLTISNNATLSSLSGLDAWTSAVNVTISNNYLLSNISALSTLATGIHTLIITDNPNLCASSVQQLINTCSCNGINSNNSNNC